MEKQSNEFVSGKAACLLDCPVRMQPKVGRASRRLASAIFPEPAAPDGIGRGKCGASKPRCPNRHIRHLPATAVPVTTS